MALAVTDNPPELFLRATTDHSHSHSRRHSNPPQPTPCTPQVWAKNFGDKPWAAALTNSRAEKSVALTCLAHKVPYFLPQKRSHTPGTRNRVYIPLFPGVLFFENNEALADIRRAKGVYQLLFTSLQKRLKAELALLAMEDADHRTARISRDAAPPASHAGHNTTNCTTGEVEIVMPGNSPGQETTTIQGTLPPENGDNYKDGGDDIDGDGKVRVVIRTLLFGQPISICVPKEYVRVI